MSQSINVVTAKKATRAEQMQSRMNEVLTQKQVKKKQ
jgi:hypothetical protein